MLRKKWMVAVGVVACMLFVVPVQAAMVDATLYSDSDTYIENSVPTANYGTGTDVYTGLLWVGGALQFQQNHVLVDFPTLPTMEGGWSVATATLGLLNWNGSGGIGTTDDVAVHKLTTAFTETGATWNTYDGANAWTTAGGDYGAAVDTITVTYQDGPDEGTDPNEWKFWDVASIVQDWYDTPASNKGMLVRGTLSASVVNRFLSWKTREMGWSGVDPVLNITYTPEPTTMALLGIGGVLALVRKRRRR